MTASLMAAGPPTHAEIAAQAGPSRRLAGALVLALGVLALEVGGGIVTGSLALLSDATHVAVDVVALLVGLGAARLAQRTPDASHSYGYHRMEALGALVNAVLLVAASAAILVESLDRLTTPSPVEALAVIPIALLALVTNSASALLVHGAERQTTATRVIVVHLAGDAAGAVAVIVSAIVILAGGSPAADAVASIVIAVLLALAGVRLLRSIVHLLAEGVPTSVSLAAAASVLHALPGVSGVHDLHVWALAEDLPIVTAHVEVAPEADPHRVLDDARTALREIGAGHATLQLEADTCGQGRPSTPTAPSASPSRAGQAGGVPR